MDSSFKKIRVLLAEDHFIFRTGIKTILLRQENIRIAGEASNGEELVRLAQEASADVIITDIRMPVMNGIEAVRRIRLLNLHLPVIALSVSDNARDIMEMMEQDVQAYLLKTSCADELSAALQAVCAGKKYFCADTSAALAGMIGRRIHTHSVDLSVFTHSEKEIMRLICEECTTKEIAARLQLNTRRVEADRIKIMTRIGAKGVAGIVRFAIRAGLYKL